MGAFTTLVGELLSSLHSVAGLALCPGDWVWTITVAGALLAVPPVLAASSVAVLRRFIGNRYTARTVLLFAVLGIIGTAVLPLLGFVGITNALQGAALGTGSAGLTRQDVADLQDAYCFFPPQIGYLGSDRSVHEALTTAPDLLLGGRAVVLLVLAPLLALILTWMLSRRAVRRGPRWPARLLWLPFFGLLVGTLPLDEGAVGQLWIGYLAGIMLGLVLVQLIGAPAWSVIHRSGQAPQSRSSPATRRRPPVPQQPVPGRPRPLPPTLMQPLQTDLRSARRAPSPRVPLAANPGRLPPTLVAAPEASRAERTWGANSARFRRLRALGEGGFGNVWLARDTVLGRDVAIKVARAPDPDTERRIRREARALAAVRHPNCVRVYDILPGVDGLPGLAIVMEYLPGPSLAQQVRDHGPLSDLAGAHLWSALAGALDAAHSHNVLHRDIKPSNIIIDGRGWAHLIDFGIAHTAGDTTLTATGLIIGTPDFLAPEVAAGGRADPRTDSWQLAATVSYALCGQPPRGYRDSIVAAVRAAATREPPSQLPMRSAHRGLLERALDPVPARRPTLAQVQAALVGWLARTGTTVGRPGM
ncbi:MAG TPA: serine/threonine-protein kinase [Pseudonocardiaceae bacterium]